MLSKVLILVSVLVILTTVRAQETHKPHVLMISIDGMKPEYVTHAEDHGLKLPTRSKVAPAQLQAGVTSSGYERFPVGSNQALLNQVSQIGSRARIDV